MCGEAVVFEESTETFLYYDQNSEEALLAKGRLLGIQFDTFFTGNLYLEISKNAIKPLQN